MAISPYLRDLRARVGHGLVLLPAVAVLIHDAAGRLLLMQSSETGRWQTIGGSIDPDESPPDAAVREAKEESGLDVSLTALRGAFGGPGYRVRYPNGDLCSYVSIVYEAAVVGGDLDGDDEVAELCWFELGELGGLTLDPLNRCLFVDLGLIDPPDERTARTAAH